MANPDAPLTTDEFDSLKEVSKRLTQRRIPDGHEAKLTECGLIEQKLGGLTLTPAGQLRLAKGK